MPYAGAHVSFKKEMLKENSERVREEKFNEKWERIEFPRMHSDFDDIENVYNFLMKFLCHCILWVLWDDSDFLKFDAS